MTLHTHTATLHTNHGDIVVGLYGNHAPKTVDNFVGLATGEREWVNPTTGAAGEGALYSDVIFHRIIPGFMIQGGDPTGTGAGGPGYSIDCELDGDNQHHDRGVLSMAHRGRDTGGSQFFICHSRENTAHLDRNHTCFGKVIEGLDIIDTIQQGDVIKEIKVLEETV